jgi:hypothetical protein
MKKAIFFCIFCGLIQVGFVIAQEPNDPYYQTYQFKNFAQIGASTAWNSSTGSDKVIVAIIDTGVDILHPDLKDNIWVNPGEIANNGIDDDNNGYVDDVNGWNFIDKNGDVRSAIFGKEEIEDVSHGTVIAGIVGAMGNNTKDGTGLNWTVKIMVIRAIDNDGTGSFNDIGTAVRYAVDMGADVISMSLIGDDFSQNLKDDFLYAYNKGAVLVAAAGNDQREGDGDLTKKPRYPICFDSGDEENWLLGVSSVNTNDQLSYFANYGTCVDLVAPGEKVFSTDHYAPELGFIGEVTGPWQGTSFAAPYVAGSAALLKAARPDWGARSIIKALLNSADDISQKNSTFGNQMGYGRLNIGVAMTQAYNNRINNQGVKNLYFFDGSKIYKYSPVTDKKIYLLDFQEKIIALDYADLSNNGQEEMAVLSANKNVYKISVISAFGIVRSEFILPSDISFSGLKVDDLSDEVVVSGYAIKDKTTRFYKYNIFGQEQAILKINTLVSHWDLTANGTIVAGILKNKILTLNEYNWSGIRRYTWSLSGVVSLDDLAVGAIFGTGVEQTVLLVNKGGYREQYIVDLASNSYIKEKLSTTQTDEHLLIKDENGDGLSDVFRFGLGGGGFTVSDSHGKLLKTIILPKIKGIMGG